MNTLDQDPDNPQSPKWLLWLKRMGIGAFFFFLVKGLVWVAIFMGLGKWLSEQF
jgi:hypothetical protein